MAWSAASLEVTILNRPIVDGLKVFGLVAMAPVREAPDGPA
jgi:hypothetical protein